MLTIIFLLIVSLVMLVLKVVMAFALPIIATIGIFLMIDIVMIKTVFGMIFKKKES